MPTWIPNTDAEVHFDNSGGTLTDQSDYISQVSMDVANTVSKFYVFGLTAAQASEGNQNWTGSIGVRPATDATGAHQDLIDWLTPASGSPGARSLRIYEPDTASGSIQWDGEIYITNYNAVSQDADGDGTPAIRQAQFEVDGAPTLTVIA